MDSSSNINEIIINDENKFDYFQSKIKSLNFSGKSSYKLVVVTCYFNINSINKLITDVEKILTDVEKTLKYSIKLDEIELFLDKTQFYIEYSLNPQKLQEKIVNHFKGRVTFKIPKSSQLFHPKAYCLMPINDDINDDINIEFINAESGLFFGSANLSEKGFGSATSSPNQELMYFTVDGKIISDFYRSLRGIATYDDDKLLENLAKKIEEESTSKENSLYKWRLINEGNFVYRENPGTIEYNLAISYEYHSDNSKTKDTNKKVYYFFDNKADDSISTKDKAVNYFKQSNEYREIVDIFLRHNPTYEVKWGELGINIFGNYYWLPKKLTDYLKDECKVLKDEIKKMFNDNEFFKTDLKSSAVKKMAGDLKANWDELAIEWKKTVFGTNLSKEELAQILLRIKTRYFENNSPQICNKYKLYDVDLIQKLRPNSESENSALLDYIYEQITQKKKHPWLGECIQKAVSSQTLKLEEIRLPRLNRIDLLDENQLGRLIEAHIRYWLRSWKEKQYIKNEAPYSMQSSPNNDGEVIEIEIKHESKVFNLKILIFSENEAQVRNKIEKIKIDQLKKWKHLIFIFISDKTNLFNKENLYREMEVYQEGKSVSCKVPITDEIEEEEKEMRFLYEIKKIFESNFPVKPT